MSATSIDHSPSHAAGEHGHHDNYLVAKKGLSSWLWTVDHKRLGIMYLASVILFFIIVIIRRKRVTINCKIFFTKFYHFALFYLVFDSKY